MRSDRPTASEIAASLENARLSVWWDRHIQAGADFSAEIEREIEAARVVVVLWSKASHDSQWVRDEAAYARDRKKLIPVRLDSSDPPLGFRQVQSLSLAESAAMRAQALSDLVVAARGMASGAPSPVAVPVPKARRSAALWYIALPVALLVTAIGWLTTTSGWFGAAETSDEATASTSSSEATRERATQPVSLKSIAVLPFRDMSEKRDQEFLAEGMAEEIINLLAKAPDLLVTARTSSFHFTGTDTKIPDIARELGVAHILEGSIRRSGDLLRVTAQLIRADNGYHVWSETYDRELRDVFATQDDIAGAVVQALRIKLMGGELSRQKGGTQNLEAYELYLQGRSTSYQSSHESLDAAVAYLDRALEIDPHFGVAWGWRSQIELLKADNSPTTVARAVYERARDFAKRALELSDDISDAHAALSYIHKAVDWDWIRAEAEAQRALAIDPTNSDTLQIAALLSLQLAHFDDAERQSRLALTRDPLNSYALWTLGGVLSARERYVEAEEVYRKLLEMAPGFTEARHPLARALVAQGKGEEALAVMEQEQDPGWRLFVIPIVLEAAGHKAEADEELQRQIEYWRELGGCVVAKTYAYRGDYDRAVEWLERCYEQRDIGILWLVSEPLYYGMADHPRFKALLRKMNLPEENAVLWPPES